MGEEAGERPDDAAAPCYANTLSVVATLSDVELSFGQDDGGGAQPRVQARIVTSPSHLPGFRSIIANAIDIYEARYAPLPPTRDR